MRRQVCWVQKLDDGIKREVRVTFISGDKIKWQFKRSDMAEWDYDTPPTEEEWAMLESKTSNRYRFRSAGINDLKRVRRLRQGK